MIRGSAAWPLYRSGTAAAVAQTALRSFSTTPRFYMGPESPDYVTIPSTLQSDLPRKPSVKGILPVPRELFPPRRPDKPGSAYLADVTPEPSPNKKLNISEDHKDYELLQWKKKMAELRRRNLREGLVELYARKKRAVGNISGESRRKQLEREAILRQPERDDERLTKPTTVAAMEIVRGVIPDDPSAAEKFQARKIELLKRNQRKMRERQDMLHTLYMNARNFIVNEDQLEVALDNAFTDVFQNDASAGHSIWITGVPTSIKQMVQHATTPQVYGFKKQEMRMQRLAETLTGGKTQVAK
ncbi:hypothetical protein AAP_05235 [Ascosphaera apis ARSEF 7405]|uniref:Uncharacterized protein n=1 Tax=Ascosphaera apis ARSEF 7405 TaxID=392613 RepID=A0A167VT67_9EURO|nr:hypothetical protein AAP_05235 [Ascosphaera apis ARSEF 7405]